MAIGSATDSRPCSSDGRRRRKAAVEIGHDVLDILEADLQADHGAIGRALADLAIVQVDLNRQAFITAPGPAQAEDLQPIEEGMGLLLDILRRLRG